MTCPKMHYHMTNHPVTVIFLEVYFGRLSSPVIYRIESCTVCKLGEINLNIPIPIFRMLKAEKNRHKNI